MKKKGAIMTKQSPEEIVAYFVSYANKWSDGIVLFNLLVEEDQKENYTEKWVDQFLGHQILKIGSNKLVRASILEGFREAQTERIFCVTCGLITYQSTTPAERVHLRRCEQCVKNDVKRKFYFYCRHCGLQIKKEEFLNKLRGHENPHAKWRAVAVCGSCKKQVVEVRTLLRAKLDLIIQSIQSR